MGDNLQSQKSQSRYDEKMDAESVVQQAKDDEEVIRAKDAKAEDNEEAAAPVHEEAKNEADVDGAANQEMHVEEGPPDQ